MRTVAISTYANSGTELWYGFLLAWNHGTAFGLAPYYVPTLPVRVAQIRSRLEASCIAGTAAAAALQSNPAPTSSAGESPNASRDLGSSLESSFASTDATANAQGDAPDSPTTRGGGFPGPNPLSPYARQSLMRQHAALAEQRKSLAVVVGRLRRMTMALSTGGAGGGSGALAGNDGDKDGCGQEEADGEGEGMGSKGREGGPRGLGEEEDEVEEECEELDEGGMAALVEGLHRLAVVQEGEAEEREEENGVEEEGRAEDDCLQGGSGEGEKVVTGRGGWLSSLAALGAPPPQQQGVRGEGRQQVESAGEQQDDDGCGRPGTALGRSRGDPAVAVPVSDGSSSGRGYTPPALPGWGFAPGQGGENAGMAPGLGLEEAPVCSGVGVQLSARGSKPSTPRGSRRHGVDVNESGGARGAGQQQGSIGTWQSAAPGVVVVGEATSRPASRGLQVSGLARGWTAASNGSAANVLDGFGLPECDGGGEGDSMGVAEEAGSCTVQPRCGSTCSSRAGWDPLRAFDPSGVSRQLLRQHPGLDLAHRGDRGEAEELGPGPGPSGKVPSIGGRPWSPAQLMAGRPVPVPHQVGAVPGFKCSPACLMSSHHMRNAACSLMQPYRLSTLTRLHHQRPPRWHVAILCNPTSLNSRS